MDFQCVILIYIQTYICILEFSKCMNSHYVWELVYKNWIVWWPCMIMLFLVDEVSVNWQTEIKLYLHLRSHWHAYANKENKRHPNVNFRYNGTAGWQLKAIAPICLNSLIIFVVFFASNSATLLDKDGGKILAKFMHEPMLCEDKRMGDTGRPFCT